MPSVIDVKANVIEHSQVVADRIERVADVVPDPSRVVAAPDCGFGTLDRDGRGQEVKKARRSSSLEEWLANV